MAHEFVTIPCLSDNYAYLIRTDGGAVILVDAPEVGPIRAALDSRGWTLTHILLTHHHADHVDGVEAFRAGTEVIGAARDAHRLPPLDRTVAPGDALTLGGLEVHVLEASGHTVGHVAFHAPALPALFSADSLMVMGCGRLFEGDAAMMWASMAPMRDLPGDTWVCSGHEYTQANARFALTVDPDNAALAARAEAIAAARAAGAPTVPARLSEELATNPYLRADAPEVAEALGMAGAAPAAVFAEIRRRKDAF